MSDTLTRDPAQMWSGGWRRYLFPAFWLLYLGQTVGGVQQHSHGAAAAVGYVIVAVFAVTYLAAMPLAWQQERRQRYWAMWGSLVALTAVECVFAHGDALVFLVYLGVLTVAAKTRVSVALVAVIAAVAVFLPPLVPSWHAGPAWNLGVTLLLVAMGMFGFFKIMAANIALAAARAEVARLAAENERSRIARDLHDLLGHSLTTITVKAGLARRLGERGDDDRARTEIAEVEQLARRTLGDVRAAVSAHRETTLAGELATSREVLRAADMIAELPASVAEVDPDVDELFGWVVREGVTNVVRHSRATHVRITVARRCLEIVDDGRGGPSGAACAGNGLRGLRERVQAVGGELTVLSRTAGFGLRVEVPVSTGPRTAARVVPSTALPTGAA